MQIHEYVHMKRKERIRNASKARNSFVTRRAELKISALADLFKGAVGEHWVKTESDVLQRELFFSGFQYLDSLKLIYNWENRFMSVNYNLQMLSVVPTNNSRFEKTRGCLFTLSCTQSGLRGKRNYSWNCKRWEDSEEKLAAYLERLSNPLITDRLNALDVMEMEIKHDDDWDYWRISCESLIGSATWILVPPILSMITPKKEECIKFIELFELLADAVANNM